MLQRGTGAAVPSGHCPEGQAVLCSMMSGSDKGAQLGPACARGVNQIRGHLFLYSRKCKKKKKKRN